MKSILTKIELTRLFDFKIIFKPRLIMFNDLCAFTTCVVAAAMAALLTISVCIVFTYPYGSGIDTF